MNTVTDWGKRRGVRRGFTLTELLIVVAIIGLLATLAFVVLSKALRDARSAVERQTVISVRNSVESYRQQFGFLPPLIDDATPVNPATDNPNIRSEAYLTGAQQPLGPRHSIFSIPYYLLGVLGEDEDGVDGPGFTEPQRDGTFARRGEKHQAFLDVSRDGSRVKRNPNNATQWAYVDRWGKASTPSAGWPAGSPIRYYLWKPAFDGGKTVVQFNTPRAVGDPNTNVALRSAQYAIVSTGANQVTDERRPLPTDGKIDPRVDVTPINTNAAGDDIVEVGQ